MLDFDLEKWARFYGFELVPQEYGQLRQLFAYCGASRDVVWAYETFGCVKGKLVDDNYSLYWIPQLEVFVAHVFRQSPRLCIFSDRPNRFHWAYQLRRQVGVTQAEVWADFEHEVLHWWWGRLRQNMSLGNRCRKWMDWEQRWADEVSHLPPA